MASDSDDDIFEIEEIICDTESADTNTEEEEPCVPDRAVTQKRRTKKKYVPKYRWSRAPFTPIIHQFDSPKSGFQAEFNQITESSSILDYFECFFTVELASKIAFETNRYYKFAVSTQAASTSSRLNKWRDTNSDEIYLFLSICMLMSRNKKLSMKEYWSVDPLLNSPIFSQTMSRDRFLILLRLLHFCDNEQPEKKNRLYKIDMVIKEVKENFRQNFIPFENLCIDESMVSFRGRVAFRQFIRTKRHRFGIKLFVLSDVETNYVLDFIVYVGKRTKITVTAPELKKSGAVITTLMQPYLNRGHKLFADNWYSSPLLAAYLHQNRTNYCGTVNARRVEMPRIHRSLDQGEVICMNSGPLMVCFWQDKRLVRILTTMHDNIMVPTGKIDHKKQTPVIKPRCIIDYNLNMGSVDKVDMMLSSIDCMRKSIKWYKKLFFQIVDYCILNAHAMYKVKTGSSIRLADFQLELIRLLIEKYKDEGTRRGIRLPTKDTPIRLTARHFPKLVKPQPGGKKNRQRTCIVCSHTSLGSRKRSETRYECSECNVGLCVINCFEKYHTLKKY